MQETVTNKKILITGGSGLVGQNFKKFLPFADYVHTSMYDLRYPDQVQAMFEKYQPTHVIHLAGTVGGVGANIKYPVQFFNDNILINTLLLKYAHAYDVEKLIAFMSTCIFPDVVEYPLTPSKIHLGEPHPSNFGYAYAKRMLDIQLRAYQTQYNKTWFSVIPTNIYGPFDNFNLDHAHVIPALIHKCYLAKQNNTPWIVWGTGEAVREFVYVDDIVQLTHQLLDTYIDTTPVILSTSEQTSIKTVVELIAKHMNFTGEIVFDTTKPEGQIRKPSDTTPLKLAFPTYEFISIDTGIRRTVEWFVSNFENTRR